MVCRHHNHQHHTLDAYGRRIANAIGIWQHHDSPAASYRFRRHNRNHLYPVQVEPGTNREALQGYLYFLVSAIIAKIFSYDTVTGVFQLWFPIGFAVLMLYLATTRSRRHPAKYKASFLGLAAALFQIMQQYV